MRVLTKIALLVGLILIVSCTVGSCWCGICPNYGKGEYRTYGLFRFQEKGIFYKTWEGHAIGGFRFSVHDPLLAEKIRQAESRDVFFTIYYNTWLIPPWSQDSCNMVYDVR